MYITYSIIFIIRIIYVHLHRGALIPRPPSGRGPAHKCNTSIGQAINRYRLFLSFLSFTDINNLTS